MVNYILNHKNYFCLKIFTYKKIMYFIPIFLILIYIEQIISNFIVINDDIIEVNSFIKNYIIINLVYNILFLLYLISRTKLNYQNKYKYDKDYFSYFDYWIFAIGTSMYFMGSCFFYAYYIDETEREKCMSDEAFRIFIFSQIPIGTIFLSITILFFLTLALFLIFIILHSCCFECNNENEIYPI